MTCAFSSSLTTTVFSQRSMRRFDVSPRRATPKGHNLHHLHSTASRRPPYIRTPLRAHGAPKQIIQITRERVTAATGERTREVVYAICSLPFEHARSAMIAAWLRGHWGIENIVHWVRDVTFAEDRSTVHTGTAPQVMASLRNTVLNMHRLTGADNIAEACRVTAFRADRGLDLLTDHRISRSQAC